MEHVLYSGQSSANQTGERHLLHVQIVELTNEGAGQDAVILEAARTGQDEVARQLLNEDKSQIKAATATGHTVLHLAIIHEHSELLPIFLQFGADVERPAAGGKTPLYIASNKGDLLAVELLLQHNANVEARNSIDGATALHEACEHGHLKVAQTLLQYGADINSKRPDGQSSLFLAAAIGDASIVEYLLQHGANKNVVLENGQTVEDFAFNEHISKILQAQPVLQGPRVETQEKKPVEDSRFTFVRALQAPEDYEIHKLNACHGFEATIVQFFIGEREKRIQVTASIYDVLYGKGPSAILGSARQGTIPEDAPNFTWYHIPANNVCGKLVCRLSVLIYI